MAENSAIQWTDATWNPLAGCTRASEGCEWLPATYLKSSMFKIGNGDMDLCLSKKWTPFDGFIAKRVGKKAAGRMLDGRTWDEFPQPYETQAAPAA